MPPLIEIKEQLLHNFNSTNFYYLFYTTMMPETHNIDLNVVSTFLKTVTPDWTWTILKPEFKFEKEGKQITWRPSTPALIKNWSNEYLYGFRRLSIRADQNTYFATGLPDGVTKYENKNILWQIRIYADIDIRKDYYEKYDRVLSETELLEEIEKVKSLLDKNELLSQYFAIINTWNGMHIYYVLHDVVTDASYYTYLAEKIFDMIDKCLDWCYTCDPAPKNFARCGRLVWSYNHKARDYLWKPIQVEILHMQKDARIILQEHFPMPEKTKNKIIKKVKTEQQLINRTIPAYEVIQKLTALELASDWTSFVVKWSADHVGLFYNKYLNRIMHQWTHHVPEEVHNQWPYEVIKILKNISDQETLLWCKQHFGKELSCLKQASPNMFKKDKEGNFEWIEPLSAAKRIADKYHLRSLEKDFFQYNKATGLRTIIGEKAVKRIIQSSANIYLPDSKCSLKSINDTYWQMEIYCEDNNLKRLFTPHSSHTIYLDDGVYDISTWEIHDYRAEDYVMHKLPYGSECISTEVYPTRWLKFLDDILEWHTDKQGIIDFLQEFIGNCFVASSKHQLALLLIWQWWNGKGVFLAVLEALLWTNNVCNISLQTLWDQQSCMLLVNKLAIMDTDLHHNVYLDTWSVKKLVSGESMNAKEVYRKPIIFSPYWKLFIASNVMPRLYKADNSIKRRFAFLQLYQSFTWVRGNPNIIEELVSELPLIFSWAIQWLARLSSRWKFNVPEVLKNRVNELVKDNDTVLKFIEDSNVVVKDNQESICSSALYHTYKEYCKINSLKHLSSKQFGDNLINKWFNKRKTAECNTYVWLTLSGGSMET